MSFRQSEERTTRNLIIMNKNFLELRRFISKNEKNLIILVLIVGISLGYYFINYKQSRELDLYGDYTTAIIARHTTASGGRNVIEFVYTVQGIKYRNSRRVRFFRCNEEGNNRKFCLGKTFKVKYSRENPEISDIDLGKYEIYDNLGL